MKKLLLLISMVMLIVQLSFAQSAWTQQGSFDEYGSGVYKVFNFNGTLDDDDTLYTNAINIGAVERPYTIWFKCAQANDSIRVNVVKQQYGASGWVTMNTPGIDSVNTQTYWNDTITYHSANVRWALIGTAASGGDNNGFNTTFTGKITFKKE